MRKNWHPEHWCVPRIGDIADVVAGGTPKAGNPENFADPGTGIAWLTPADLSGYSKKFIAHGKRDLSKIGYDSSSAKLLPAGSLLFSSRAPIGYVAVAQGKMATNQGFKNFVFLSGVDSSYAYFYLRSINDLAESLGTGTTFKEISGTTAKTLPFALPPLAEQKAIAKKLDTLLAQVETTKTRLDRIPDMLKRFRQSVLAAAVSGKLTEEWCEGADSSWNPTDLGVLAEFVTSGSRGWAKYYAESGSVFIRSQDINTDDLDIDDPCYVALPIGAEGKRTKVRRNDILLTITGANVTKCARIKIDIEDAYVSQHVALIRLKDIANSEFVELALKSLEAGRKQLTEMAYGGGKPGLNLQNIKDVTFSVPSPEEQTQIVKQVKTLFAHADAIEQQVQAAQTRVNSLTQSILAKAFRGELTAEWRAANLQLISGENSAEALLAKIKAERDAAKPKKKARARK